MTHTISAHHIFSSFGRFLEHAAAVAVGLIMMVVGLALGVTMIMLPVGLVMGLLGFALVVAGLFTHFE
jgi:hypothetical protein